MNILSSRFSCSEVFSRYFLYSSDQQLVSQNFPLLQSPQRGGPKLLKLFKQNLDRIFIVAEPSIVFPCVIWRFL